MVGCDGPCGDWFHLRCMGLTQAAARAAKQWACPLCRCTAVSPASLHDMLARTCRTRWVHGSGAGVQGPGAWGLGSHLAPAACRGALPGPSCSCQGLTSAALPCK